MVCPPDFVDECYKDKYLSLLKKLTLVIPTYNRNYYLSRCLWYHAHFPFGQIIVADSSPEEKKVVNRETVAKIREMFGANVRYLEYRPEAEKYGGDIYRKWEDAVQHVVTDYSIICIDKAFLEPTWLTKSIKHLDGNVETVSVYGNWDAVCANRCCFSNGKYIINKDTQRFVLPNNYYDVHQQARDRIYDIFKVIPAWRNNQLFAVTRAELHKLLYSLLIKYEIDDVRYGELIVGQLGNIYGNIKYIDGVMCIRDIVTFTNYRIEKRKMNSESSDSRYPHFIALSRISPSFHEKFTRCINGELKKIGEDSIDITINDIGRFDNVEGSKGSILVQKHKALYNIWFTYVPIGLQNVIISVLNVLLPTFPKPNKTYLPETDEFYKLIANVIANGELHQKEDEAYI